MLLKIGDLAREGNSRYFNHSNAPPKFAVDTRWAPTRKLVGGKKNVKARLVAKGYRDPDAKDGLVETFGCVSRRSSRRRVLTRGALKKMEDLAPGAC